MNKHCIVFIFHFHFHNIEPSYYTTTWQTSYLFNCYLGSPCAFDGVTAASQVVASTTETSTAMPAYYLIAETSCCCCMQDVNADMQIHLEQLSNTFETGVKCFWCIFILPFKIDFRWPHLCLNSYWTYFAHVQSLQWSHENRVLKYLAPASNRT